MRGQLIAHRFELTFQFKSKSLSKVTALSKCCLVRCCIMEFKARLRGRTISSSKSSLNTHTLHTHSCGKVCHLLSHYKQSLYRWIVQHLLCSVVQFSLPSKPRSLLLNVFIFLSSVVCKRAEFDELTSKAGANAAQWVSNNRPVVFLSFFFFVFTAISTKQ